MNMSQNSQKIAVILDYFTFESILKQVSYPLVFLVIPINIAPTYPAHHLFK